MNPIKLKTKQKIKGKDHERIVGITTNIEVYKSSIWKPYHNAEIHILYDYGIDDIRSNLQYIKSITSNSVYMIGEEKLSRSLDESILMVEEDNREKELKMEVIDLWNEVEGSFDSGRKPRYD